VFVRDRWGGHDHAGKHEQQRRTGELYEQLIVSAAMESTEDSSREVEDRVEHAVLDHRGQPDRRSSCPFSSNWLRQSPQLTTPRSRNHMTRFRIEAGGVVFHSRRDDGRRADPLSARERERESWPSARARAKQRASRAMCQPGQLERHRRDARRQRNPYLENHAARDLPGQVDGRAIAERVTDRLGDTNVEPYRALRWAIRTAYVPVCRPPKMPARFAAVAARASQSSRD
jgi:hypothetical protein